MAPPLRSWALPLAVLFTGGCTESKEAAAPEPKAAAKAAPEPKAAAKAAPEPKAPAKAAPDSEAAAKAEPEAGATVGSEGPPPGPPIRTASRTEIEQIVADLVEKVKAGASDPTNPWALAHGLLAFGKDLKATDGRLAIDVIVSDYARVETVAGKKVFGFPTHYPSDALVDPRDPLKKLDVPVEPHPDLLLKSLVEAGVPMTRTFRIGGRKVALKTLVDDAAWAFTLPKTESDWHKFAWSAALFLQAYGPEGTVKSQEGEYTVAGLITKAVQRLERDQGFLLKPMQLGRPDLVQKRKQGIYGHTCGGLHFVQTAAMGAGATDSKGDEFRMRRQLDLVAFRWDAERRIYREMIRTQPKYRFLLLVQEMKFHGHVLETLAIANRAGVLPADDETRTLAQQVAADLVDAIVELQPMYAAQEKLEKNVPQSYFDLIGDGCHAIRGLRWTLKAFYDQPKNP